MAIESGNPNINPQLDGSTNTPHRWVMIIEQNRNQWVFTYFIDSILRDIEEYPIPGEEICCLIWDTLVLHKTKDVTSMLQDRNSSNNFLA